eukprot:scaffold253271_cov31-Tisochrysis_lutea.AAC.7
MTVCDTMTCSRPVQARWSAAGSAVLINVAQVIASEPHAAHRARSWLAEIVPQASRACVPSRRLLGASSRV